jgi:glycosyltransferase involved in cell wall biosynthesis
MEKNKVLIIAYYFPPMGMGGVQRVAKFVKYLPFFGWKPYVLTVKEVDYWAKDHSLLEEIPPEVKVMRTGSFDPLRISFILKSFFKRGRQKDEPARKRTVKRLKFASWLFFPDNKAGWIPFALMKGLKLCRREKINLIFSSSPPPSLHLTAYMLKFLTGLPWVADFRDPWIEYRFEIFPTPFHLFLKKRLEKLIIQKADKVITANPAITTDLESRHPHTEKIQQIDQGYDEEDFASCQVSLPEIFTIGYLGTFSPDCDPEPFLAALGGLIGEGIIPKDKIRLVHVGLSMGIDLDHLIEKYNLKDVVLKKGYLSHRESVNEMKKASLLLLVTSDHPLIFPAKVYEYLRFKKPILGIIPKESRIAKFLTEIKAGKVISPEDKEGIRQVLVSYFTDFAEGKMTLVISEDEINRFERKSLTFKLASLLDEVVGR